jgi:hypothetical protein
MHSPFPSKFRIVESRVVDIEYFGISGRLAAWPTALHEALDEV